MAYPVPIVQLVRGKDAGQLFKTDANQTHGWWVGVIMSTTVSTTDSHFFVLFFAQPHKVSGVPAPLQPVLVSYDYSKK